MKPIEFNKVLSEAAKFHVLDIGTKGLMQHESSDGTKSEERIHKFLKKEWQYKVIGCGESLSSGQATGKDVVL